MIAGLPVREPERAGRRVQESEVRSYSSTTRDTSWGQTGSLRPRVYDLAKASSLIGRAHTMLPSHWSKASDCVEIFSSTERSCYKLFLVMLRHKDTAQDIRKGQGPRGISCQSLCFYGRRVSIIDPFREWKPLILMP